MEHPEGRSEATGGSVWERDDTDEPQLVRPYTLTAGRTDSRINLPLEAPVETLASQSHRAGRETTCAARS